MSETTPTNPTSSTSPASAPPAASPSTATVPGGAPPVPDDDGRTDPVVKILVVLIIVGAVVGLALLLFFVGVVRHWLAVHTGTLHAGPDVYYNFWSGFGSDLGEATLISAVGIGVYTGVRKVNCHAKGCWRIGHHQLDGTPYILCRVHHPHVPAKGASHQHILAHYHRAQAAKTAEQPPKEPLPPTPLA